MMPVILPDNTGLAVIDCRNPDDYTAGHISGATSIPAGQLFQRMHELAQRHVPVILCGDENTLGLAHTFFSDRGFIIAQEILWSQALQAALQAEKRLESGPASRRLWQPSPLLAEFIADIVPAYPATGRQGLDIACGAGRDLVYLAMHGWQMCGIDYAPEALQRTQLLASHHKVRVSTLQLDMESQDRVFETTPALARHRPDLICICRYLHRPLLPQLKQWLNPGGFIVYQTFMQGCEKIGSPRNPRFLLAENELASIFSGFDIIRNQITWLDDGRPMSAFIARKPA